MTTDYLLNDEEPITATNDHLKQIGELLSVRERMVQEVGELEEALKIAKENLRFLEETDLPAVMDEAGLSKVTAATGAEIRIVEDVKMSVAKKNKAALASWLLENGHGALVQSDVIVHFKKGEDGKAASAVDLLANNGFSGIQIEESMHTGQLKALYKELRAGGKDLPDDLFGAYNYRKAVVKFPEK